MVSTFSPNIQLEEPARGDQVGTWDAAVNPNMTLLDLTIGGITSIALNNSPVVLSAAQFQCSEIVFSSTLTGNVAITFPASISKHYIIRNACTGSSAFIITLGSTVVSAGVICPPPGDNIHVVATFGGIGYHNLDRIGTYWDYAGSSVPAWVSGCTVPPYLQANGGTFSATTYPFLAVILGSTTLPDARGRARYATDASAGRLSSAVAGFNPDTVGAGGGSQNFAAHNHNLTLTDPTHRHLYSGMDGSGGGSIAAGGGFAGGTFNTGFAATGITVVSSAAGTGTTGNVPPAYIGGITMIRAG